jgi:hypothetical protein
VAKTRRCEAKGGGGGCEVARDILKEFLETGAANAWEVMSMLLMEWNRDDARAVWRKVKGIEKRDVELLAMRRIRFGDDSGCFNMKIPS